MPDFKSFPVSIPTSSSIDRFSIEGIGPTYNISYFRPGLYKVIRFKSTAPRSGRLPQEKVEGFKHTDKLSQSVSRSRRLVLEYALCNDWKWFGTLTIDAGKDEREDLKLFYNHFYEWIKYQRQKTGKKIPYLLVPEKHKKRGWHLHGFFDADVDDFLVSFVEMDMAGYRSPSGKSLPRNLVRGYYFDWPAYRKRFGFCSFGRIRNQMATARYTTKYITKSLQANNDRLGLQSFYKSEGLNKAEFVDSVYARSAVLDSALQKHYKFCSIGFYEFEKVPGYDPILDVIEECGENYMYPLDIFSAPEPEIEAEVDNYYEATQLALKGF